MVLQLMGLALVMYVPQTVTWLIRIGGLDLAGSTDFVPGSFATRLTVSIFVVAMMGVLWGTLVRRKYNRTHQSISA